MTQTGWGGEHIMGQDTDPSWELQVQRAGSQPHGHLHLMAGGLETHLPQGSAAAAGHWQSVCAQALRPLVGPPNPCPWGSMAFAVNGPLTRARGRAWRRTRWLGHDP